MSTAFRYRAVDPKGRRSHGLVDAPSRLAAYERLRARGLSPLAVLIASEGDIRGARAKLGKRALADFLLELGELVAAGVPFRRSLGVLGGDDSGPVAALSRRIESELSDGHELSEALARALGRNGALLAALVAAGEVSGDLGGALKRGARTLRQELDVADALLSALAYPCFILLMAIAILLVILTIVVPTLRPLALAQAEAPPLMLGVLFAVSDLLIENGAGLAIAAGGLVVGAGVAWRLGWLRPAIERALLDGPAAPISRPIVFGRIAAVAGALLAARVNASDAFRLAASGASVRLARGRIEALVEDVRQGVAVSVALAACKGAPLGLSRLAAIGEETGTLGQMLERSGEMERERALKRMKAASAVLGPALIVGLGVFIGLVFAGLLTGVTSLGVME